jgi:hypothetical protein
MVHAKDNFPESANVLVVYKKYLELYGTFFHNTCWFGSLASSSLELFQLSTDFVLWRLTSRQPN